MAKSKTGYTKTDNTVRCRRCSVGVGEGGENIGAPVGRQGVTCQVEPGRAVLVATLGRCTKEINEYRNGVLIPDCNAIYNFKMEPEGVRFGLEKRKVLNCVRHSQGNYFELSELEAGKIDTVACPMFPKGAVDADYVPGKFTESATELMF